MSFNWVSRNQHGKEVMTGRDMVCGQTPSNEN